MGTVLSALTIPIRRLWLGAQRFELRMIDLFPGDEEIEPGVKLFEVGILSHLKVNLLHMGRVLEFGDLDPEFFITGKLNRQGKASTTELGRHVSRTKELIGQASRIFEQFHDRFESMYKGLCLSSRNSVQEDGTVSHFNESSLNWLGFI